MVALLQLVRGCPVTVIFLAAALGAVGTVCGYWIGWRSCIWALHDSAKRNGLMREYRAFVEAAQREREQGRW